MEGVVVSAVTGVGVAGVKVTVFTRQALRYETTTDDSGSFRFAGAAPGSYELRLEKPQPYRIAAGQEPIRIRLEMTRQPAISELVLDDSREYRGTARSGVLSAFVGRGDVENLELHMGAPFT
jgi:hypothetical protein